MERMIGLEMSGTGEPLADSQISRGGNIDELVSASRHRAGIDVCDMPLWCDVADRDPIRRLGDVDETKSGIPAVVVTKYQRSVLMIGCRFAAYREEVNRDL